MANRHGLARRVSALLDSRQPRGRAGANWIGLTCAAAVLFVIAVSPLQLVARFQASAGQSQPAAENQKFEVASVKPCKDEPALPSGQRRQEFTVTPGRVRIDCRPLDRIIYFAYAGVGGMNDPLINDSPPDPTHVRGGPGWVHSENFTIEAKAEGTPDRTVMMGPMLRALLAERFQLKTHREIEEVPMYALTVARGGLKIQPIEKDGCTSPDAVRDLSQEARMAILRGPKPVCGSLGSLGDGVNAHWTLGGETLDRFATTLSGVLDRHVTDRTSITGPFNIHLDFGLDDNIRAGVFGGRPAAAYSAENPPPPGIDKGPSIFIALEEQLGLKLEKTRGPRGFIIIDRAEKPAGL